MSFTKPKKPARIKSKPAKARTQRADASNPQMADCAACKNFNEPARWPDTQGVSCCDCNGISLAIQLDRAGYRRGIWFCRMFKDKHLRPASAQFQMLHHQLEPGVLYALTGANHYLIEHRVADLPKTRRKAGTA